MVLRRIRQRKEKRQKMVMGLVISFLMVASGFGVYLSGRGADQNAITDYGIKFKTNYDLNVFEAKIANENMFFYFLPSSVLDVVVTAGFADNIRSAQAVVVTFDPNLSPNNLQAMDIIRFDFSTALGKPIINAVVKEHPSYNLPLITCDNATVQMPVISFEVSNTTRIVHDGPCVRISGNESGFFEARDRFLYEYYNVYD